jgi:hypothetical protein
MSLEPTKLSARGQPQFEKYARPLAPSARSLLDPPTFVAEDLPRSPCQPSECAEFSASFLQGMSLFFAITLRVSSSGIPKRPARSTREP